MQKPPGKTPPLLPPQEASHTPPAEMKYTWGAAVLVQDFATRWHARRKHLSSQYSTTATKKEKYRKRINRSSTSQTNTPTHIHANSFKTHYKFIAIYRIQQKETSSA